VLYCNRVSISNDFRDNGHFIYLGHDIDLSRSRDVISQVTNRSVIWHFLLVPYWNRISILNRFRDICIQIYLCHDLTFLGHVTSSVTWLFDSTGAISYRCSFATESLSLTFFNIMVILYIWVTILTFLGHVTSSVMWPIDPPYPFPIGVPLEPNLYLEPFSRYLHPNISGSRLDLSTSRDVIVHVTIWFPRCHFL